MCNWDSRELVLDLSFLGEGDYKALIFKDGINADRDATDFVWEERRISSSDRLEIQMSTGGGWVARIGKFEQ
jgi:alpha-glucosidase